MPTDDLERRVEEVVYRWVRTQRGAPDIAEDIAAALRAVMVTAHIIQWSTSDDGETCIIRESDDNCLAAGLAALEGHRKEQT